MIGTQPPLHSPPPLLILRLSMVVACNHGDSWSCYLLRGERRGARDFGLGLLVTSDEGRLHGGMGTSHKDYTVLRMSIHCWSSQ